jgi:hypothetical protein
VKQWLTDEAGHWTHRKLKLWENFTHLRLITDSPSTVESTSAIFMSPKLFNQLFSQLLCCKSRRKYE